MVFEEMLGISGDIDQALKTSVTVEKLREWAAKLYDMATSALERNVECE